MQGSTQTPALHLAQAAHPASLTLSQDSRAALLVLQAVTTLTMGNRIAIMYVMQGSIQATVPLLARPVPEASIIMTQDSRAAIPAPRESILPAEVLDA